MNRRQWSLGLLGLCIPLLQSCQKSDHDGRPRIACVGDSITFGLGLENRERNSYPAKLQGAVGETINVRNFGLSGTTLLKKGNHPYWTTKAYHNAIEWKPDIVVIKLGTNDTKPINWKHSAELSIDLGEMISNFQNLPSKPQVFICLPVPAFPERWGIKDTIIKGELIPIIRTVAEQKKCTIIDLYSKFEGKKELFPDKVHPNADGARLLAEAVHAAIEDSAKLQTTPTP